MATADQTPTWRLNRAKNGFRGRRYARILQAAWASSANLRLTPRDELTPSSTSTFLHCRPPFPSRNCGELRAQATTWGLPTTIAHRLVHKRRISDMRAARFAARPQRSIRIVRLIVIPATHPFCARLQSRGAHGNAYRSVPPRQPPTCGPCTAGTWASSSRERAGIHTNRTFVGRMGHIN